MKNWFQFGSTLVLALVITSLDATVMYQGTVYQNIQTVNSAGLWKLSATYRTIGGARKQRLFVNGLETGIILFPDSPDYQQNTLVSVILKAGANTIQIVGLEGFMDVTAMSVQWPSYTSVNPSSPNFSNCWSSTCKKKLKLMKFFQSIYGKSMLSGQEELPDAETIKNWVGDYPVILGLDFIHYSKDRPDGYGAVDQALSWLNQGGLVEFCWHWKTPTDATGQDSFYSTQTNFDLNSALQNTNDYPYQSLMADIDVVIRQLKRIQSQGHVVLFRPLHEAQGAWFWWGKFGSENYKKLYQRVYSRISDAGLDNLIWIYTSLGWPQSSNWNPGRSYYDILATDIYFQTGSGTRDGDGNGIYGSLVQESQGTAMITFAEHGKIPTFSTMASSGGIMKWLYFKTWFGMIQDNSINGYDKVVAAYKQPNVYLLQRFKNDFSNFGCSGC